MNSEKEEWRTVDIEGFSDKYIVSSEGDVMNVLTGELLSKRTKDGYQCVTLINEGKRKDVRLHVLVGASFIPCNDEKLMISHKDGNKNNNKVENLIYVTRRDLSFKNNNLKTNIAKKVLQYDLEGNMIASFSSVAEAARHAMINESSIRKVCKGERTQASGYIWKYEFDHHDSQNKFVDGKEIFGYEDYLITQDGIIYSKLSKKNITAYIKGDDKSLSINLTKNGKRYTEYVHNLLARTYIKNNDNCENNETKNKVIHINGDKKDNRLDNLKWISTPKNKYTKKNDPSQVLKPKDVCIGKIESRDILVDYSEKELNEVEIWKPIIIDGINNYYMISSMGRVSSTLRDIIVKPNYTSGYPNVRLTKIDGGCKTYRIHQLVAKTFLSEHYTDDNDVINHKNGNKFDNRLENLELISQKDNVKHSFTEGLIIPHTISVSQYDLEGNKLATFKSIREASLITGCSDRHISSVCKGNKSRNMTGGYIWRYEEGNENQSMDGHGKQINGYDNYLVTEDGKIYSKRSKKWLKLKDTASGYLSVGLCKDGKKQDVLVHRIVCSEYIYNDDPINKKYVNHKNKNKKDNRIENLEWVTQSENMVHANKTKVYSEEKNSMNQEEIVQTSTKDKNVFFDSVINIKKDTKLRNNNAIQVTQYTLNGEMVKSYSSIKEASLITNVNYKSISLVCKGEKGRKTAGGYIWKYS